MEYQETHFALELQSAYQCLSVVVDVAAVADGIVLSKTASISVWTVELVYLGTAESVMNARME